MTPPPTVRYVGHSTVLVDLDGVRLLTDPLLRKRVAHLRRVAPLDFDAGTLDAVLVSHAHYDHLDLPSLEQLGRSLPVVVPLGVGPLLVRRGFEQVIEVEEGGTVEFGGVRVRATHANHSGDRGPRGGLALGYAIEGQRRFYFAGDTDLFAGMDGLVPSLDVALLPIWGWGATLGRGRHLDPVRAAEALTLLRPKIAVPIHWGTYRPLHKRARAAFLRRPVDEFVQAAMRRAPEVEVRILEPGDSLALDEPVARSR